MASSKKFINIENKYNRVIVLIDMDCFYCQVEEKLNPALKGKPIAVVQYNAWRGGGIIAVNYPARSRGVTRHMRGDEAKEQCPDIELISVPSVREKADLTKYREAGKEVAAILQTFTPIILERASVDEAYIDITEKVIERFNKVEKGGFQLNPSGFINTFAVGYESIGGYINEIMSKVQNDTDDFGFDETEQNTIRKSDLKLLIGASIVSEMRAKVKEETGYECSAGIAHNKILAKIACGINKPNKQTLLPLQQINLLFSTLPVQKVKGLGGKFGEDVCEKLRIKYLGELLPFSENELKKIFDSKTGSWLYLIARGIDLEMVTPRFFSKSIGCCKKFPGRNAINGINTLNHWLSELAKEICERLEADVIENNRRAKQLVVSFIQEINGEEVSNSRSSNLINYNEEKLAILAFEILRKNTDQFLKHGNENVLNNPIKFLGISVGKFEGLRNNTSTLQKMFLNQSKKKSEEINICENTSESKNLLDTKELNSSSYSSELNSPSKNIPKIIELNQKHNLIENSCFPSTLKKNTEIVEIAEFQKEKNASLEYENKESSSEKKSFFLNALKKKSTENICEKISSIDKSLLIHSGKENYIESKGFEGFQKIEENEGLISGNSNRINNTSDININYPCTSFGRDDEIFTSNYAEYLLPKLKPEDYIICKKCEKSILSFTMQTHMDFHFAFELSQEQRKQFRTEIRAKALSPPPKKQKPNINITPIDKFLVKTPLDSNEVLNSKDMQRCTKCGLLLKATKMLEHLDYHVAEKLQLELNKPEVHKTSKRSKTAKNNSKTHSIKTIETFFTPKT